MKRILGLIAVLVLMSSVVWADDIMDKDLITPLRTDQVWLIDDPAEMPVEGRASIATIFGLLQASDVPDVSATYQAVASLETDVEALVDIEDLQGAATDAQVPNDITIDLATLASTVTVSDDESTNDEHEVVFTTDGATMESDGDFAYNPSTGTVSATVFSGTLAGANLDIVNMTGETSIAADDLILIYDTSATANRAMTRGNFVTGIGAGQAVTFDIGDDGGNDSVDVGEIATTGDTNSIFTEPSADKILIDLTNNWPTADAAVAAASQVITDNAIATVDDADAADNDFAKFTANGLEGRSYAEVRQDLGIDSAANLETSLSLGAYASDILGAADSDALVTLLGLQAGDIPDLSATYEAVVNSSEIMRALIPTKQ
jgi:hypothetical protein